MTGKIMSLPGMFALATSLVLTGCGDDGDPVRNVDDSPFPSVVDLPDESAPTTSTRLAPTLPTPRDPNDPGYPTVPPPTSVTYPSVEPGLR